MQQNEEKPTLFIDLKKNRIRIYKQTLHLLGNPEYVQLLVNPDTGSIAVCPADSRDHLSHRIRWEELSKSKCCELYSRNFLQTLRRASPGWEANRTYRIQGDS